jgi:hypothetical protein
MHYIPNTPTISKKQRPLKEVLMTRCRRAHHALNDNTATRMQGNSKSAWKPYVSDCQD